MNPNLKNFKFLPVFFAFIIFALLIDGLLGEAIYNHHLIDDDNFIAVQRIKKFNASGNKNKIVIIGSSMSREGLDERYLRERFPESEIYNFSISNGVPSDFFLIYNNLKNRSSIKMVVVCVSPWMFQKRFSENVVNHSDINTNVFFRPWAYLKIVPWKEIDPNWFLARTVYSFLNVLKFNDYLKQIADHNNLSFWKLDGERSFPAVWPEFRYSKSNGKEYFLNAINDPKIKADFNGGYYWSSGSVQIRSLNALADQLENQNVKFMVVNMPINPHINELYGKDTESNFEYVIGQSVPSANFFQASSLYDESKFIDFNHLNFKGRQLFTRQLGEKINSESHVF